MMMGSKALLYASETDLVEMKTMLHAAQPFIRQFTQTTNLVSFFEQINSAFLTAPREANADTESLVKSLPALTRIVTQATDSLQRSGTPPSPNVITLFGGGEDEVLSNYITFANGRIFLVTTHAPNVETKPAQRTGHPRPRKPRTSWTPARLTVCASWSKKRKMKCPASTWDSRASRCWITTR